MTATCKTCKHAKFSRTPSGRIAKYGRHECTYPVILPPLPNALVLRPYRVSIQADYGGNCPTWEAST